MSKIILDLCGGTGAWSRPYTEAGYDVRLVTLPEQDVRLYRPPENVHGILAAPPCTHFAVSGARWWKAKGIGPLLEGLAVVDACLRIIWRCKPAWWSLENPTGRLRQWLGSPVMSFQPWEYGDPWMKRTCLWGVFQQPVKKPCDAPDTGKGRWKVSLTNHLSPTSTAEQIKRLADTGMIPGDWIHRLPPSADRATLRSITPPGFAKAFFEANP